MAEVVQSRHDAKTKAAISIQQALYQDVTGQLRAHICEDRSRSLDHVVGAGEKLFQDGSLQSRIGLCRCANSVE